jgi:uncharacterized protein (DUF885 family)
MSHRSGGAHRAVPPAVAARRAGLTTALVATIVTVLAGCAAAPTTSSPPLAAAVANPPAAATRPDTRAIDALAERYFDDWLALNPVAATFLGDDRFDDRLGNPASLDYLRASRALEEKYLADALAIDPARLPDAQRLTWDAFVRGRRLALRGAEFPYELIALNQMDSLYSTLAVLGSGESAQPFRTPAQHEKWLKRASEFPAWVDAAIERLRDGARRGVTLPQPAAKKLVPQLDQLAGGRVEDTVFWSPVRALGAGTAAPPAGFTIADRERLAREYRTLIGERIVPALKKLRTYLATEYVPACRTTSGWSALPDGARWYAYAVEAETTTQMSPEEIHRLGLSEVARIRGEMEAVKKQVGFQGDLHAFFRYLQTDPKFYFDRPEDLIAGYQDIKRRIDAKLPTLFRTFPKADYEVRPVEAFRAESAAGGSYQNPSEDGTRPGIFYVNTFNLKAQPKFGMETLSLHEASPGHHFQIAIQQELHGLPRFRRFGNYSAYAEGWALYAESIGKELGMFTDPYQWYGRLSDEMLRAMRLVVDTGLHAKGWSREQAIAYMLDNSSMTESDVTAEVERYMVWPGQALGYKIGQLRITAMRARAERELGSKFDVKAFHDQVLKDGALPLDVLDAKIDRWIAATKAGG